LSEYQKLQIVILFGTIIMGLLFWKIPKIEDFMEEEEYEEN
jgi:hypothetical protein